MTVKLLENIMKPLNILLTLSMLLVGIFTLSFDANANACFEYSKQRSEVCRQYSYDKLNAYFRDNAGIEQKVIIKRVLSKANGQLLHANYDFEVQCHNQLSCSDTDNFTTEVLWAFRNAINENRLYTISYKACDPQEQICCNDEGMCNEILRVGDKSSKADISVLELESLAKRGKKIKKEQMLRNAEAATNIMDNVVRNVTNGFNFKQEVINDVLVDMPTFAYTEISSGNYTLCKLERSGLCNRISGRMSIYGDSGYAELSHDEGQNVNLDLFDFLWKFYIEDRGMTCSQTMNCGGGPINQCEIRMTCQVR